MPIPNNLISRSIDPLKNTNRHELHNTFSVDVSESIRSEEQFIKNIFETGGKATLARIKKYGLTENGKKLILNTVSEEAVLLIADFRISEVLTTGAAQVGKTLLNTLIFVDFIVHGKMNAGWFYDSRDNLVANVGEQFIPMCTYWCENYERVEQVKLNRKNDRKQNRRYQVDNATAIFAYASTSRKVASRESKAAAGGAAVSFQANYLVYEERSQWPDGVDPRSRLEASSLITKPIRQLGTPGGGNGIERDLQTATHEFYPHVKCNNCGEVIKLDPKGCVLKQFERLDPSGQKIFTYFSPSGRPQFPHWHHKDPDEPVKSAFIACSHCEGEITLDERVNQSWLQCIKTNLTVDEFKNKLPVGVENISDFRPKVGIHFSPLTKRSPLIATDIIRSGMESKSPADWQQQILGHPSETESNSVTLKMISAAMNAPVPDRKPDLRLAGGDQGRSSGDWLIIVDIYLPDDWGKMSITEVIEQTIRVVKFGGAIARQDILDIVDANNIDFGIYDSEPDIPDIAKICKASCFEMADQRSKTSYQIKAGVVSSGMEEFPCWLIRYADFMKQVLDSFLLRAEDGHPLIRLPQEWEKWFENVNSELSPFRHLMGPSRDSVSGKWVRGEDNIDDLYYALMFSYVALAIYLEDPVRLVENALTLLS